MKIDETHNKFAEKNVKRILYTLIIYALNNEEVIKD